MYSKPQLARFGTFRDLTQSGCVGATDNVSFTGTNGVTATAVGANPDPDEPYRICLNFRGSR